MNKKIFGIKIKTYLQMFLCLLVAVAVWLFVQYTNMRNSTAENEAFESCETVDCVLRM